MAAIPIISKNSFVKYFIILPQSQNKTFFTIFPILYHDLMIITTKTSKQRMNFTLDLHLLSIQR